MRQVCGIYALVFTTWHLPPRVPAPVRTKADEIPADGDAIGKEPLTFQSLCAICIVPECGGVFLGLEFRTNLWDKYSTAAAAILAAIQRSQESLQTLATRHGINGCF